MNILIRIRRIFALRARLSIIVTGIGCELIYLFYFVRNFSLLQYGHTLHLTDLGTITHHSSSCFILFVLAFSGLFGLFGLAWWDVRQEMQKDRGMFFLILGFGIIFAGTMVFCYPITATDVFAYIAQSHILITYHANPLVIPAATFARDPLMALTGQWRTSPAPYGPLAILLDAFPTLLAGRDVFLNLILLKCIFAAMLPCCGWLVYTIASEYAPGWALSALLLFAWNPLLLLEYSANGHNDVAMMLFVLLALLAAKKERLILAFACIIVSFSIKYATASLLPLFFCYGIVQQTSYRRYLLYIAQILAVFALLIIAIYGPFWAGPRIFDSVFSNDTYYLSSFSALISDITPLHLTPENSKLMGRFLCTGFSLYALFFLTHKRLRGLAEGSALIMFMFLAFGVSKFESWYAIWGIALLVLVSARGEVALASLLFSYGAALIAPIFAFLWIWGGRSDEMLHGVNALSYLLAFVPALFLLAGTKLHQLLSKAEGLFIPRPADIPPKTPERSHHLKRNFIMSIMILFLPIAIFLGTTHTLFASSLPITQTRVTTPANTAMTTYHNNNFRDGLNANETILTKKNVNSRQFGKRVTYPVDGLVYAQPLFQPNVSINGSMYNVVFVATEHDSVYAFDADQTTAVAPLWKTSFLSPTITSVPGTDLFKKYGNIDIAPEVGITGTPVIDPTAGTLYVDSMTEENGKHYVQRLHALDITTGLEKPGSPITIQATVAGTGYDNVDGKISFNAATANQRSALLLSNGSVYICWASFGDTDPYHGWLIGYTYDGSSFHQNDASVYNDTPDGQEGGIWMSAAGPSVDNAGNLYLITGNGTYNLDTGGSDAGDSMLKLSTEHGLSLSDYFTPFNQSCLSIYDQDLGSGGPLLLPDQTNTPYPHLMISAGKEGRIYVVNRDTMGHYTPFPGLQCGTSKEEQTTSDKVLQELPPSSIGALFSTAAYWASTRGQWIYINGFNDSLKAFQIRDGVLSPTPTSQSPKIFSNPGATPSISSNGTTTDTGIVWIISPAAQCPSNNNCIPADNGVLRAYSATNLRYELYNSTQDLSRDMLDSYVRFSVPTIANGKVFVGTSTGLSIYGLLDLPAEH